MRSSKFPFANSAAFNSGVLRRLIERMFLIGGIDEQRYWGVILRSLGPVNPAAGCENFASAWIQRVVGSADAFPAAEYRWPLVPCLPTLASRARCEGPSN